MVDELAAGHLARDDDGGRRLAAANVALVGAVLDELRGACEQHGVDWPDDVEHEIRDYIARELGPAPSD